jgi:hypothetical protein
MPEIILLITLVVTILWLVIGWRAMRAHESIAHAVTRHVAAHEVDRSAELRSGRVSNTGLYKQFIDEDLSRAELPARDRHEAFRKWCEKNASFEDMT